MIPISLLAITQMSFMRSKHSPSARLLRFAFPFTSAAFAVGCASYLIATHGQTFEAFDDNTDALAQSRLAQAFNPHGNRTLSDIYVARVPLERIDAGLLSGDCNGSSSLVERYAAGLLGGWGELNLCCILRSYQIVNTIS